MQVLVVVVQPDHVGPGQEEVLVWMMVPVCPVGQESVWFCGALGVQDSAAWTAHEAYWYIVEPERVPFWQVLSIAAVAHADALSAVRCEKNFLMAPFAMVTPSSAQDWTVLPEVVQEEYAYEPERVPLVQVRVWETHCIPKSTMED